MNFEAMKKTVKSATHAGAKPQSAFDKNVVSNGVNPVKAVKGGGAVNAKAKVSKVVKPAKKK